MAKTDELIRVLQDNPDRELIFMYPDEGSDYPYTMGNVSKILVDEYVTIYERVWLRNEDGDELFTDIAENLADELYDQFPLTDEQEKEVSNQTENKINDLEWKKAVMVYIHY